MPFDYLDTAFPAAPSDSGKFDYLDDKPSLGGFAENALSNVGRAINPVNIAKGLGETVKQGAYDMPKDFTQSLAQMAGNVVTGQDQTTTPVEKYAENIGNSEMVQHPVDYAYKNPLDTAAMLAAPFAGLGGKLDAAGVGEIGAGEVGGGGGGGGGGAGETTAQASLKDLPVVEPGAKTGAPHALFAYNDEARPALPANETYPAKDATPAQSKYQVFGDENDPLFKTVAHGTQKTYQELQDLGVPITGRTPRSVTLGHSPLDQPEAAESTIPTGAKEPSTEPPSRMPPDPNAPKIIQDIAKDPLQDVNDYLMAKYKSVADKPGIAQRLAKMANDEATNLRAKDLGLMRGQLQSMGPGYEGLEKAKALTQYAGDKGYFDPALTDVGRRDLIKANMNKFGEQLGALRDLASQRAKPPTDLIRNNLQATLQEEYGIKAPTQVDKVLALFDKATKKDPSFSDLADLATDWNKEATPATKMGQHPGPFTDGANTVAKMGNDAARATMNPKEQEMFTQSLRDYGAHKKLEQATAAAGRKAMVGRGAPGSLTNRLVQNFMDRAGYRLGGNIASRTAKSVLGNPKIQTLPQFFEELAHQSNDVLDDTINGMAHGGVVPNKELNDFVTQRYGK